VTKLAKKAKKSTKRVSALKADELFSAAHANRTVAASKIYDLWVEVLGRPIKDLDDSPNEYNIMNVVAYAAFLNATPQFKLFGLDLQQSDVVNVATMGRLGSAIVRNLQENGWTVTPT